MFKSAYICCLQPETSFTDKEKRLKPSHKSGEIPEMDDAPLPNTKHARHSPNRDGIGDGLLLNVKDFGEDWMSVPNNKYGSKIHIQVDILVVRFSLERVRSGSPLVGWVSNYELMCAREQTKKAGALIWTKFHE